MEKQCKYCQELFNTNRKDTLYCSHSCSQMAYIERKGKNVNTDSEASINTSQKNANPSIDGLQNINSEGKASIDYSQNINKNHETSIDSSEKTGEMSIYPSINTIENINTSIDTSGKTVNVEGSKTSIDTSANSKIDTSTGLNIKNKTLEAGYSEVKSRFIEDLAQISYENDNRDVYHQELVQQNYPSRWVSLRFKCLAECLLTVSEMKCTNINALKEICNAFTLIINSNYFKSLSDIYPYSKTIVDLRELLREICLTSKENEWIRFRFRPENKKKMIVIRLELMSCIPKRNFNELNFKE